jgi:glycosyltransferase involved in cell wall biosynthesis
MKICIDVRCLMQGRRTGVEEYTLNLLLGMFEEDKKNYYVLFYNAWKNPSFDFSIFEKFENVKIKRTKIPNKLLNFSFWYLSWPKIDELCGGADVLFMPNINFGATSKKCRLLLTMHDLSYERYPEHFSLKRRTWHSFINTKKICTQAEKIIAVSNSTKNDLVSLYKMGADKIEAVYSAVSDNFRIISRNDENLVKIKEKYKLPYKFFLYLGTIEPRKNISGIVQAYGELKKFASSDKNSDLGKYKLVVAGEKGWLSEKIYGEIMLSKNKEDVIVINSIPEEEKVYLYNLASLFVYPSFFEGFGFPPLEAMRCGIPVIVANNSSLPEIVGDGEILIDPDKPDEICQAMKEILLDRELEKTLIKKGLKKSNEFNWKETAFKYLGIIKKMI